MAVVFFVRHVFKPMLHAGYSKLQAATVVFLISAFFHEVIRMNQFVLYNDEIVFVCRW